MSKFNFTDRRLMKRDGYTLAVTVGAWAKPKPFISRNADGRIWLARMCFGWVSFICVARDLENLLLDLQDEVSDTRDAADVLAQALKDRHPETFREFFESPSLEVSR